MIPVLSISVLGYFRLVLDETRAGTKVSLLCVAADSFFVIPTLRYLKRGIDLSLRKPHQRAEKCGAHGKRATKTNRDLEEPRPSRDAGLQEGFARRLLLFC